jgi:excisionase family DNA binding protein
MNTTLAGVLEALGIPRKPRYSIEEVAEILGIRRYQVVDLLRKGKLTGMKSSMNRWRCVFATELDAFIQKVNAPRHAPQATQNGDQMTANAPSPQEPDSPAPYQADPILSPDAGLPMPLPASDSPVRTGRRDLDI